MSKFWEQHLDLSDAKSQDDIFNRIIFYYKIRRNNPQFISDFKDFLRDTVLTAREADYLISLDNPQDIVSWVKSWAGNQFFGQSYIFSTYCC